MSKIKDYFKKQDIKKKSELFDELLFSNNLETSEPVLIENKQELMNNLFSSDKDEGLIEELFDSILNIPDIIKENDENEELNNVINEVNKKTDNKKEDIKKDDLFDILLKESLKKKDNTLVPELSNPIEDIDVEDKDKLTTFLKKLLDQVNSLRKQPKQFASGGGGGPGKNYQPSIDELNTKIDSLDIRVDDLSTDSVEEHEETYNHNSFISNETDPIFSSSPASGISAEDIINWNNNTFPGFDTLFTDYGFTDNSFNWDTAYGWGDHAIAGYLTSESDPIFMSSPASGISAEDIINWDTAYGWGDHAIAGYLTSESGVVPYSGATNDVDLGIYELKAGSGHFGDDVNYTNFSSYGHQTMTGSATVFKDELQSLLVQLKNNPSDQLVVNVAEGTLDYKDTATLVDYAVMNVQINHDWKTQSIIYPHIHWFQNQNQFPNWLVQYRWQINSQLKGADWVNYPLDWNVFTYVNGILVQITGNQTGITPPSTAVLSDILQLRLIRDTDNDSTEFTGADAYTGLAAAINFDIHYEINSLGSDEEYVK